jgi:hypothetical protein
MGEERERRRCAQCGNTVATHPNGRLYPHKWIRTWRGVSWTGELQPWCLGDDEGAADGE